MEAHQALIIKPWIHNTDNRMKINLKVRHLTSLLVGRKGKDKKDNEVSVMGQEEHTYKMLDDMEKEEFQVKEEMSSSYLQDIKDNDVNNDEGGQCNDMGLISIIQRGKGATRNNHDNVTKVGFDERQKEEKGANHQDKEYMNNVGVGNDIDINNKRGKVLNNIGHMRKASTSNIDRLQNSKNKKTHTKVLGLKSQRRVPWTMKARKKVKVLKLLITTPSKVMRIIRNGYVRMMRAIANKGSHGLGMTNQSLTAGALLYPNNSKAQIAPLPTSFLLDLVCTNYKLSSDHMNNTPSFNKKDMEDILRRSLALSQKQGPKLVL